LAYECLRRTDEELAPIAEQGLTGRSALEAVIRRIMPLAQQFHFLLSLWSVAEEDERVRAIYERQLNQLSVLVDETKAEGAIDRTLSTEWVVTLIDAQLAAAWWMLQRCTAPMCCTIIPAHKAGTILLLCTSISTSHA